MFIRDTFLYDKGVSEDGDLIERYTTLLENISGLRLAILSGVLVKGSTGTVDVLMVGNMPPARVKSLMKEVERDEGRELNYSVMSHDDFYYRLSVRDKFITEIINGKHRVVIDKDNIIAKNNGGL
jgi:hypothetical protein